MRTGQRGITLIGWLFLLIPLAIVVYAGIRLTPVYLNYMKVSRTLERMAEEMRNEDALGAQAIRTSLQRRLDIESVNHPSIDDFQITRDGRAWTVRAEYEDIAPLFANVSLLLTFDKSVQIGSNE
jgi:hypothetical protein|nr:MAG: hypothetical protein DIU56_12950 [Pseudomonadota bacterium]